MRLIKLFPLYHYFDAFIENVLIQSVWVQKSLGEGESKWKKKQFIFLNMDKIHIY